MNIVWPLLFCGAIIYSLIIGDGGSVMGYLAESAAEAIALMVTLAGAYTLWCGVLRILKSCGALDGLKKLLAPVTRRLFPSIKQDDETLSHISANFAANMLGLGNAATPAGISAVKSMAEKSGGSFTDEMGLFIVINCSSLQIIPTTVITLRAQAGSLFAGDIFIPSLITTALTTIFSVTLSLIWLKIRKKQRERRLPS